MELLSRIELYMARTATRPTTFSRAATHDPRFVDDLRKGRRPRAATAARINAWLDRAEDRV